MTESSTVEADESGATPEAKSVAVVSEPLTYHQHARHSFFKDMLVADREPSAARRLDRHEVEMRSIREAADKESWRRLHAGDVETRVNPNTNSGTGGYFTTPLWLNQQFATAPRADRIVADLIRNKFDLPEGVSSVNLPIITQGTKTASAIDDAAVSDQDVQDAPGSSVVATITGQADTALQLLEQSPAGAHLDWAFFTDLNADYDAQLENQLLNGLGAAARQILGVLTSAGTAGVTYTSASPNGAELYPYLGQAIARVGNNRSKPPECWIMRSARWGWLSTSESTQNLPFGLPTASYIGDQVYEPNPVAGLIGFPVFCDDLIPQNLGAGGNQDVIAALRPSDMVLLESAPVMNVNREVLSGSLGVRIQMHKKAAAITNRYLSGISPITGTGLVVAAGFKN